MQVDHHRRRDVGRRLTGDILLRLDIFGEVGLHPSEPLFDTAFDVSASFSHISQHWSCKHLFGTSRSKHTSSGKTQIWIGIGEDLQIKKIHHTLIVKSEDAFQYEHMWRVDACSTLKSVVLLERVDWDVCLFASLPSAWCRHDFKLTHPALIS